MAETIKDFDVIQSDTKNYKIVVMDSNGAPISIVGYKLFFTVKTSLADPDESALISKTITCPDNADSLSGIGYILLSPTDTNKTVGNYAYDIKIQNTDTSFRKTIVSGKFKIQNSATIRTT